MDEVKAADVLFGDSMKKSSEDKATAKPPSTAAGYKSPFDTTPPESWRDPLYKPEAAKPEPAKTEAVKPEAAKPEAAKPEAAKPEPKTAEQIAEAAKTLTKEIALDPEDVRSQPFAEAAVELNLTADQAKRIAKLDADTRTAYWKDKSDAWAKESHKEFSSEDIAEARGVVVQYGDRELAELLDSYGLGNHPAVIRALARISRALD